MDTPVKTFKSYIEAFHWTPPEERKRKSVQSLRNLEKRIQRLEKKYKQESSIEMSLRARSMVQHFCKYLSPMDPIGLQYERVGRSFDGGYVLVKRESGSRVAYSLGIKTDVSWDLEMAERGYDIFQYDHTIKALPFEHPRFNFRKKGITGETAVQGDYSSMSAEIEKNGHQDQKDMLLKMDVEGHEWSIFNDIPKEDLCRFSQIAVEFHGLKEVNKLVWQRPRLSALVKLTETHQVVHVHGNNNSALRVVGGYPIPSTLEVTFLRKDICDFKPCSRSFPTALDQPNNPNFAEHMLGMFQFPEQSEIT